MEDELVTRRAWLTRQRFLDLLAAANMIPGPSSTELAIYIGYDLAGVCGLILAGVCFIFPAVIIVLAIAWAYVKYGPGANGGISVAAKILYGVKPVLIPILLQAAWRLGLSAIKNWMLAAIGMVALTAAIFNYNPVVVLFGTGLLTMMLMQFRKSGQTNASLEIFPPMFSIAAESAATAGAVSAAPLTLTPLFLVFLKVGAIIFGSGYVLLTFLRADLVVERHWLTESQLLDAIAVGQVTPGPVFTTATFIGYLLAGVPGALIATLGIFLPAFFLVAFTGRLVSRMRQWPAAGAFLDGLNVAAIALIVAVTWQLGFTALIDIPTFTIAAVAGVLLFWRRINTTWLVLGGGIAGLIVSRFVAI